MSREPVNALDAFWREFSKNQAAEEQKIAKRRALAMVRQERLSIGWRDAVYRVLAGLVGASAGTLLAAWLFS